MTICGSHFLSSSLQRVGKALLNHDGLLRWIEKPFNLIEMNKSYFQGNISYMKIQCIHKTPAFDLIKISHGICIFTLHSPGYSRSHCHQCSYSSASKAGGVIWILSIYRESGISCENYSINSPRSHGIAWIKVKKNCLTLLFIPFFLNSVLSQTGFHIYCD